ncbi:MAG: transposase [Gemmataceae bacterium]|nr:transposase [Gemmataceae bacterium]MCI0739051.1 transposase [Gemmataceae bacterium]
MASVTIDIDLPEGVEITGYERFGEAHGFEVTWPWPEHWCCPRCRHEEKARWETTGKARVIRDLDVWGQPSFWAYPAAFHRCSRCHYRQDLIPPFKRKDASYTLRFEKHVVRLLIGSNEQEVARRLGIAAETVARIVKNQVAEAKTIDPARQITDVGIDEISLKKRHKLYVTVLTDLTRPEQPEVLAVVSGRDEDAARRALAGLTGPQRAGIKSYRVDMAAAYNKVCAELLANAQGVTDRFHVAKLWGDAIDGVRKKNHACPQSEAVESGAEGVSRADVGVPQGSEGPDRGGAGQAGGVVHAAAAIANAVRLAAAFQDDLRHGAESASGVPAFDGVVFGRQRSFSGTGGFRPHL